MAQDFNALAEQYGNLWRQQQIDNALADIRALNNIADNVVAQGRQQVINNALADMGAQGAQASPGLLNIVGAIANRNAAVSGQGQGGANGGFYAMLNNARNNAAASQQRGSASASASFSGSLGPGWSVVEYPSPHHHILNGTIDRRLSLPAVNQIAQLAAMMPPAPSMGEITTLMQAMMGAGQPARRAGGGGNAGATPPGRTNANANANTETPGQEWLFGVNRGFLNEPPIRTAYAQDLANQWVRDLFGNAAPAQDVSPWDLFAGSFRSPVAMASSQALGYGLDPELSGQTVAPVAVSPATQELNRQADDAWAAYNRGEISLLDLLNNFSNYTDYLYGGND